MWASSSRASSPTHEAFVADSGLTFSTAPKNVLVVGIDMIRQATANRPISVRGDSTRGACVVTVSKGDIMASTLCETPARAFPEEAKMVFSRF